MLSAALPLGSYLPRTPHSIATSGRSLFEGFRQGKIILRRCSQIHLSSYSTPVEIHTMPTGKVKWYKKGKGFAFIKPSTGGDDYSIRSSS